ncbi:MAG TPA: LytR C-terminal domain-containing protein [Acidimicrobiia bacterium]
MTMRGRHSSDGSSSFYRDLAVMIGGIVLVGAAVFFVLVLLADNPEASTTTTIVRQTTTTLGPTTTSEAATSTTVPAPTTTEVAVRDPSEVRVQVLNSMGLAGAAGRLTQRLSEGGYQTLPASDYSPEQDPSRIWYRDGFSAEANVLLEFIPGATVEALPSADVGEAADVVIILGTGYEE